MSCIAPDVPEEPAQPTVNKFAAADIAAILRQRGCIQAGREISNEAALQSWLARAASLLGPFVPGRATLDSLLELLFTYDADAVLRQTASHGVLARSGAREVIRELAHRVIEGGEMDSDRFKKIIEELKAAVPYRSRAMFHPIRIALTGRAQAKENWTRSSCCWTPPRSSISPYP